MTTRWSGARCRPSWPRVPTRQGTRRATGEHRIVMAGAGQVSVAQQQEEDGSCSVRTPFVGPMPSLILHGPAWPRPMRRTQAPHMYLLLYPAACRAAPRDHSITCLVSKGRGDTAPHTAPTNSYWMTARSNSWCRTDCGMWMWTWSKSTGSCIPTARTAATMTGTRLTINSRSSSCNSR